MPSREDGCLFMCNAKIKQLFFSNEVLFSFEELQLLSSFRGHIQCACVYVLACMCVRVCACVYVLVHIFDTPELHSKKGM